MDFLDGFIFINILEQIADFRFIIPLNSKMRIYTSIPSGKSTFFDLPSGIYLLIHGYSYPLTDKPKDTLGSSIWIYQNNGGDERIGILLTSEATTSHVFIGYQYGGLSKLTWISLT